jgi:hypothetical protein
MTDIGEAEREFRRYFMTGPFLEDWHAWANLFTDDATYFDHFYGTFTGPDEITRFLEGTMGAARSRTPGRPLVAGQGRLHAVRRYRRHRLRRPVALTVNRTGTTRTAAPTIQGSSPRTRPAKALGRYGVP